MKFVGAGGVGTGAGILYSESTKKTVELLIPQVVPPEDYSPGIATWYNTVCHQCTAGCGISVRVREGRAKKIEGNPLHPVSQGRLCSMGQAGVNALYNPDRIRTPLQRSGERGSGNFTEISWDDALTLLGNTLGSLKIQKRADRVVMLSGGVRGHLDTLFSRFMKEMGSDHYLQYEFAYPANQYEANRIAFGTDLLPYYDIKNTRYLLSFGADYLGTWLSPVHYSVAYGHLRQGEDRHRGTCVQVEPRMSLSGASADEWIIVTPGTEGLLAMGIAHGILAGGHYTGADSAEWTAALASYSPASVAERTGVAADDIARIAGEFMSAEPGLAIGGGAAAAGTNGVATLVAVNLLNYLSGNLGKPGGVLFNPDPVIADAPKQRLASHAAMLKLIDAMAGKEVDALLLHQANPVYTLPPAAGFAQALGNVGQIVSLSSFMDETTAMADLILPTHTYLEAWADDVPEPGVGVPIASLSQPVVTPVFDTRASGDIILALAHQIGGELPAKLPWNRVEDYLAESWKQIYAEQSERDAAFSFDDFWRSALKAGVWAEKSAAPVPQTDRPADTLKQHLKMPAASFDGDAGEYPYYLHPYLTQAFHDGRGANLPWMQELPDPLTSVVYASWVELNPQTAADLGVTEGDVLEVTSPAGSLRAPAFLYPAIRPDVVAMPFGQGHAEYGRYAKGRGANPAGILGQQTDEDSGALAWAATRVRLSKTGERIALTKTAGVSRTLGRQILGPAEKGHG